MNFKNWHKIRAPSAHFTVGKGVESCLGDAHLCAFLGGQLPKLKSMNKYVYFGPKPFLSLEHMLEHMFILKLILGLIVRFVNLGLEHSYTYVHFVSD